MDRLSRSALILPLVLGFVLPACGGSPEDDVRSTVKAFAEAVADQDGDKACAQLTAAGRKSLTAGDTTCAKVFGDAGKQEQKQAREAADKVDDLKVKIKGDKATVTGDDDVNFKMVKSGGDWKLDIQAE